VANSAGITVADYALSGRACGFLRWARELQANVCLGSKADVKGRDNDRLLSVLNRNGKFGLKAVIFADVVEDSKD
jgi:hypothetical protein